jgi:class 3 adenylate cyclase
VAASAPAPLVERRLVSALFADLVGFTTISESRDPEQIQELLTAYFETTREIVGWYGGTIKRLVGDGILVVWGAPIAHRSRGGTRRGAA